MIDLGNADHFALNVNMKGMEVNRQKRIYANSVQES